MPRLFAGYWNCQGFSCFAANQERKERVTLGNRFPLLVGWVEGRMGLDTLELSPKTSEAGEISR